MDQAFFHTISPVGMILLISGTALGIVVGAIPGLTGTMLIALALPFTFGMDPLHAMLLLISLYVGAISGGMVTATLLRMPGTPASIVTTFDGYPLAVSGKPERALGLGVMASLVGGLIGWLFLFFLAGPIAVISRSFGPFDYFSLVMMAMVLIASVGGQSLIRSLLAGSIGILLSVPGISPATGQPRMTCGWSILNDGLPLLPVLIGLFAVNQILQDSCAGKRSPAKQLTISKVALSLRDLVANWVNLIRSSVVGTLIGMLPGIGANIGSVTAYTVARSCSRTPEQFGNGSEEGIIAAESANNATIGGALIPLVSMGLPGSVVEAVLLSALVIHGFQPGPRLFEQSPQLVYVIIFGCLVATVIMGIWMLLMMRFLASVTRIPNRLLLPSILLCCLVGSYAIGNRWFDVWVMLACGVGGFALEKNRIPLAPLVIGFVLGPIAEENLTAGLMSTHGNWSGLVREPKSLVFLVSAAFLLVLPQVRQRFFSGRKTGSAGAT